MLVTEPWLPLKHRCYIGRMDEQHWDDAASGDEHIVSVGIKRNRKLVAEPQN